jgi:hypothetical protein
MAFPALHAGSIWPSYAAKGVDSRFRCRGVCATN